MGAVGLIDAADATLRVRGLDTTELGPSRIEYTFPGTAEWSVIRVHDPSELEAHRALGRTVLEIAAPNWLLIDAQSASPQSLENVVFTCSIQEFDELLAAGAEADDPIAPLLGVMDSPWPVVRVRIAEEDRRLEMTLFGGPSQCVELDMASDGSVRLAGFDATDFMLRLLDVTGVSATSLRHRIWLDEPFLEPVAIRVVNCTTLYRDDDDLIVVGTIEWVELDDGSLAEVELSADGLPTSTVTPTTADRVVDELLSFLPKDFIGS